MRTNLTLSAIFIGTSRLFVNITWFVKRAYNAYFKLTLVDQDKKWAPLTACHTREEMLHDLTKEKRKCLLF